MSEIILKLPRPHVGQLKLLRERSRFNVVNCGRRFGKTVIGNHVLIPAALEGYPVAWASPTYKMLKEAWLETKRTLAPITVSSNASDHRITLSTGGVVEMWSMENFESIRGRKYKKWVIDEAAMVPNLGEAWRAVIRPTLTDYKGGAWMFSTPRGMNFFNECYRRGADPLQPDWASWSMPTVTNPFIDPAEVEGARLELPERVYRQEYLAEFIEDAGGVFRNVAAAVKYAGRCQNEPPIIGARYSAGADLARLADFTVITVVDETGRQVYHDRFNQISWQRQMSEIQRVSALYNNAPVTLDCTGVGDPIFEGLRERGVHVVPFKFSSSSKEQLINNLAMRIEQGDCDLLDIEIQTGELQAYEYQVAKSGHVKMSAPEGQHDDCVCGLALAFWGFKSQVRWEWD